MTRGLEVPCFWDKFGLVSDSEKEVGLGGFLFWALRHDKYRSGMLQDPYMESTWEAGGKQSIKIQERTALEVLELKVMTVTKVEQIFYKLIQGRSRRRKGI